MDHGKCYYITLCRWLQQYRNFVKRGFTDEESHSIILIFENLWDTVGLGDGEEEGKKYIKNIRSNSHAKD